MGVDRLVVAIEKMRQLGRGEGRALNVEMRDAIGRRSDRERKIVDANPVLCSVKNGEGKKIAAAPAARRAFRSIMCSDKTVPGNFLCI